MVSRPTTPVAVADQREVAAPFAHRAQRGVGRLVRGQRQHRPHEAAGAGAGRRRQRVAYVHHADELLAVAHHQPQVPAAPGDLADLLGARVHPHRADRRVRPHQRAQRRGVQLQRGDQPVVPLAVQRPGPGRVGDELAQAVRVVARGELVHRLDADPAQAGVRQRVERHQQRPGDRHEGAHRQREQDRGPFRVRDGPRLRRHLADHQVHERHRDQRGDERDHVGGHRGQAPGGEQRAGAGRARRAWPRRRVPACRA